MSEQNVTPGKFKGGLSVRIVIIIFIAILAVGALLSGFYQVDQTQEAVVLRLGRYHKTTGAGLHGKAPFGIDKIYKVQTTIVHTVEFGYRTRQAGTVTTYEDERNYSSEALMLTGDLNIVSVQFSLLYKIDDPLAWLFNVERSDRENEKTIRDIAFSVINELVGDRSIFEIMGNERENIEFLAVEKIESKLSQYNMGIDITEIKLQKVVPPAGEVSEAFEDVNKSIQDMNRLINEGKEAYNTEIPRVEGQAERVIQEAEGYAQARVFTAQGDVARFDFVYAEYRKNPGIMRDRLYYEMIEAVLTGEEDIDIIDRNLDNFLPLKNLGGIE